ncbi:MAG: hypothetical protein R2832_19420 [Rhodothermales bacterium]
MQPTRNRIVGFILLTVLTAGGVIAPIVHQAAHDIAESHTSIPSDHRHSADGSDTLSNGILPGPSSIHCALCAQHVVSVAFDSRSVVVVPADKRYFTPSAFPRSSLRSDRGQPRAPPARI